MMNNFLTMTNMKKKKKPITTKITTKEITNMMKWTKTSKPIFYNKQINFRSYMKLNNTNFFLNEEAEDNFKKIYLKIQRKAMNHNINNTYRYKRIIYKDKKIIIKAYV